MGAIAAVTVRFLGRVKRDVGLGQVQLPMEPGERVTLGALLRRVQELYPRLREYLSPEGRPRRDVIVLFNGVDVNVYDDLDGVPVEGGSELVFVPITHGG